jgi:L-malate glycosyltransferase
VIKDGAALVNLAGREHWNGVYMSEEPQIAPKTDPIRKWIEAHIPKAHEGEKTCIEIGCYPGRYLSVFGELGYSLSGIDLTDRLDVLPAWLRFKGYQVGSFWKMDFLDSHLSQKFDVVASFGFLEHFTNWDAILAKHICLVKAGGYLILETPNFLGGFQRWIHVNFDSNNYERHCISAMDIEKWGAILRGSQFDIIYGRYFGGFTFWTLDQTLTFIQKLILKILRKSRRPLNSVLPKDRKIYSPFCGMIARKRNAKG